MKVGTFPYQPKSSPLELYKRMKTRRTQSKSKSKRSLSSPSSHTPRRTRSNQCKPINVDKQEGGRAVPRSSDIKIAIRPHKLQVKSGMVFQVERDLTRKYHHLQLCPKVIVESILTTLHLPLWQPPFAPYPPYSPFPNTNFLPYPSEGSIRRKRIIEELSQEEESSEQVIKGRKRKGRSKHRMERSASRK